MEKAIPAARMDVADTAAEAIKRAKKEGFVPLMRAKPSFFLGQLHKGHHIRIPGGIAKEHLQRL